MPSEIVSDMDLHPIIEDEEGRTPAASGAAPAPPEETPGAARAQTEPPGSGEAFPGVRIVGSGEGIVVRIGEEGAWSDAVALLHQHLEQAQGFFQGQEMALEVGNRLLNGPDLELIRARLGAHEVVISAVRTTHPETVASAAAVGLPGSLVETTEPSASKERTAEQESAHRWEVVLDKSGFVTGDAQEAADFDLPQAIVDALAADASAGEPSGPSHIDAEDGAAPAASVDREEAEGEEAPGQILFAPPYLYRGSLRSGQVFRHAGPVIVLGDVNPGAEVISGGDIFVWGRLRGMAHAGALGDESALVAALDFEPVQVRIAGYIAMSPKSISEEPGRWFWSRNTVGKPEVARVVKGQIIVDTWDAR